MTYKYKLMVSYNAGGSYHKEFESDELSEVEERARKIDERGLRWTIESNNEIVGYCAIHKDILSAMAHIRAQGRGR